MRSRSVIRVLLVLVAGSTFVGASASDRTTCPAGRDGGVALTKIGGRAFSPESGGSRETLVTSYCVGCHDGSISKPVLVTAQVLTRVSESLFGSTAATFEPGAMHRVDVAYPEGRHAFRPISEVELSLPLNGGLVTCDTCHSGGGSTPFHLTVSNVGSRLCLICHEK